jgi:hypothetical protein
MSLTTIFNPSQPVLLGLTIALPVLLLVSFFSRKIAANLNEKQETPSAAEVILYGFSAVSKLLVAPLAVYVLYTGGFWLLTNASADFCHTLGQIGRVVVVLLFAAALVLSVVAASVGVGLRNIDVDAELEDLENNREYKALKAIGNALPPAWVCVGVTFALIPLFLVMLVVF